MRYHKRMTGRGSTLEIFYTKFQFKKGPYVLTDFGYNLNFIHQNYMLVQTSYSGRRVRLNMWTRLQEIPDSSRASSGRVQFLVYASAVCAGRVWVLGGLISYLEQSCYMYMHLVDICCFASTVSATADCMHIIAIDRYILEVTIFKFKKRRKASGWTQQVSLWKTKSAGQLEKKGRFYSCTCTSCRRFREVFFLTKH